MDDVIVNGNSHIRSKTLLRNLNIKKSNWLSRSEFDRQALKLDLIAIKNRYIAEGYLDVDVNFEISEITSSWIVITYSIVEGDRYDVSDIRFIGNQTITDEQLWEQIPIKIGDYYNPVLLSTFITKTEYNYFSVGKILSRIDSNVAKDGHSLKIELKFDEGNTYSVGAVDITGLIKYPSKFVSRELVFQPGDIYDVRKVEKSQRRIFSSGLFSSVEIIPQLSDKPDIVNLEIKVREYSTRQINTDMGVGQEPSSLGEGAPPATIFEFETKWQPGTIFRSAGRLELGGNLTLRLDEEFSMPNINYEVNWFNPWIYKFRIPLRFRYFHEVISGDQIDGLESSFLYKTGEKYNLSGSLNMEFIKRNVESGSTNVTDEKRSFQLNYVSNRLDDFIFPSSGDYYLLTSELNGAFLGGEHHYILIDSQFKKFSHIFHSVIAGYHFRAGFLHVLKEEKNNGELPPFYKFKLGGSTSLRGWQSTNGINENGGLIRIQSNIEARFPVYKIFGVEVFYDVGKLTDQLDRNIVKNWNWDIGFGLTVKTPVGPVRLDFAYPYAKWSDQTISLAVLYLF